jgi:hypothetical protein
MRSSFYFVLSFLVLSLFLVCSDSIKNDGKPKTQDPDHSFSVKEYLDKKLKKNGHSRVVSVGPKTFKMYFSPFFSITDNSYSIMNTNGTIACAYNLL